MIKRIKNITARYRKNIIIYSSAVLFLIALTNLYFVLEVNVTSNDECLWIPHKSKEGLVIKFDRVKVNGVAWNAGIRDGDELLEIDHKKLPSTTHAQIILNQFKEGDFADYTIKKYGNIIHTQVYIKKLVNFPFMGYSLLSLIWLVVGFIVAISKPEGKVQRLFFKIGALLVLFHIYIIFTNIAGRINPVIIVIMDFTYTMAGFFLPFLIVRFFWMFPRPFKFLSTRWVDKLLIFTPLVLFLLVYIHRVIFIYDTKSPEIYYRVIFLIQNYLVLISFIIGLISLVISYLRLKSKEERRPLVIILFAYIICLSSIVYTATIAPVITDTIFNSPEFYTPIILVVLLPVSFGISIFRYQLMDVSIVVKNAVVYGAATITLAAVYFFVIYILGQGISTAIGTEYQGIIAGLIFIIFAIIFQSTKDKFQEFLTAKFYPEQFAYQKVLLKFSSDIPTVVGRENILDSTMHTFVDALRIDRFGILMKEEEEHEYKLVRSMGIENKELAIKEECVLNAAEESAKISRNLVFEEQNFTKDLPDAADYLIKEGIYTIIPMIIKNKIIGVLMFGLKHSGAQFAGKDLELLTAAASQAAVALENARLYKSEAEKLKIERDLDLARKIQQGLLPKCIPFMSGLEICGEMIPAMQVGGDYFDLIQVSPTKLFVVVGDVSGKGLSASLYMTKLQTMMQVACTEDRTPKEILVDINKKLYYAIERNWFVTMTVALFDIETKQVHFCRAGHMPIITADNGFVNSYRTQGLGVGLEKGVIFESTLIEQTVDLKTGQIYAFFSDGITEAMNSSKELFGEDNLISLLKNQTTKRSSEIMNDIWSSVKIFRGKAEQNDDMTMVLVKISENIGHQKPSI